jgi:hypothetical protein
MTETVARTIDELRGVIARILTAIEEGGGEVNLRDLKLRLIDLAVLIDRDPGLMAAVEDLFNVTAAKVMNRTTAIQPEARMQRLMREARHRFDNRLDATLGGDHDGGARPFGRLGLAA